jgi:hypothetical protein
VDPAVAPFWVLPGQPEDQGLNVSASRRPAAPYYLITELEWDTMDELRAAFASPEGRATAADAARLQESAPVRRMIFTADETAM